jgi:hypothetical protein
MSSPTGTTYSCNATPLLEVGEGQIENHVIGVLVNKIVDHVKCELGESILYEITYDKANAADNHIPRNFSWLDDSVGTLTLTMTVHERSSLGPATLTSPMSKVANTTQTVSVGFAGGASADATRKQQFDFVFNVRKDFLENKSFNEYHNHGLTKAQCKDEYSKTLLKVICVSKNGWTARCFPGAYQVTLI